MRITGIQLRRGHRTSNDRHMVHVVVDVDPEARDVADAHGKLLRVPLVVRNSVRGRIHTVEAAGIVSGRPPFVLFADIPLPAGRYDLLLPGLDPRPQRRFMIGPDGSFRTFCRHPGRNPTSWSTLWAFSPAGGPRVVLSTVEIRRCCRTPYLAQRRSWSDDRALVLILSHRHAGRVEINGKTATIRPGEYLVVNPTDRNIPASNPRFPVRLQAAVIHQQALRQFRDAAGLPPRLGPFDFDARPRRTTPAIAEAVASLSSALVEQHGPDDFHGVTVAYHHLLLTLLRSHPNTLYARRTAEAVPPAFDPRLARALEHMRTRFAELCPIDEVSLAAGASPSVLRRLFRRHLGQSPLAYLQHVRIEKAKSLLRNPRLSLRDIAELVGYADERNFRRLFRSLTQKQIRTFRGV